MTPGVLLGAVRGAVVGGAAVAVVAFVLLAGVDHAQDDFENFLEFILVLTLLPALVIVAGLVVGAAVRLKGWPVVALVAPVLSFFAIEPLPSWEVLQGAVTVLVYAVCGGASTAIIESRSPGA